MVIIIDVFSLAAQIQFLSFPFLDFDFAYDFHSYFCVCVSCECYFVSQIQWCSVFLFYIVICFMMHVLSLDMNNIGDRRGAGLRQHQASRHCSPGTDFWQSGQCCIA